MLNCPSAVHKYSFSALTESSRILTCICKHSTDLEAPAKRTQTRKCGQLRLVRGIFTPCV